MMYETVKKSVECALIAALAFGPFSGGANAQEGEEAVADISNVLFTFHLVQADGFTDEDPEISDVVSELRQIFNFQGYRLLSTSVLNVGLSGRPTAALKTGEGAQRVFAGDATTQLTILAEVSSRRSTGTVRAKVILTDELRRPMSTGGTSVVFGSALNPLLEATVTIRDGQRVVLGTARRAPGEPILILVVTPRIDR